MSQEIVRISLKPTLTQRRPLIVTLFLLALLSMPAPLPAGQAGPTQSGAAPDEEHAPPDGPFYPGAPKSSSRLQAPVGDYILRVYGTLLLNVSMNGTAQVGQEVPLWPLPGNVNVTFPDGTTTFAALIAAITSSGVMLYARNRSGSTRNTMERWLPPNGGGAETPGSVAKSGRTRFSAIS